MGAGIQAAREMGQDDASVLVDITPYTFGTSVAGVVDGEYSLSQFVPLIRRNTKLPVSRSDVFFTMYDLQEAVEVKIYQGEAADAMDNILLGNYMFNLTKAPAGSEITLHFDLDLNGILKIKAVEKISGKHIDAVIENALPRISEADLDQTRDRIDSLWSPGQDEQARAPDAADELPMEFAGIVRRAEAQLNDAAEDDREEIINLIEDIRDAVAAGDMDQARRHRDKLSDLMFYLDA